jgi:sigma-B regulation protein RsbU (phosphoserine phosphatase)
MVTGIFSDVSYEEGEVVLEAGDRVILFTDGITEARSAAGAEFGDEGLLHAVMSRRHRDAATLVQGIFEDVTAFTGAALEDDATALVAAVTGRSPAVAPPNGPVPEADRHPAVPASARREPRYLTPARMWHTL